MYEPNTSFFIYLADDAPDQPLDTGPAIIPARDLMLPDLMDMAFRYTVMEFNTAIKADSFLDLLTNRGFEAAIYLDPDTRLFGPLSETLAELEAGASAVLTPHILAPLPEGAAPSEAEIMKSGVFNLGFAAFSGSQEGLAFLRWWARKLHSECYSAPEQGLFVDQRFVDMTPAFIDRLVVIRHPGYNVAYWNTATRTIAAAGADIHVNGMPLVFFHYSGVVPGKAEIFSKHLGQTEQKLDETVFRLVGDYLDSLKANGQEKWSRVPYAFARFRNGSAILPPMRRRPPFGGTAEDWFAAPDTDYWNAPDPRVDQKKGCHITRLMIGFWEMRPDLQVAFPLGTAAGRRGLRCWYHRHGIREYDIGEAFWGASFLERRINKLA